MAKHRGVYEKVKGSGEWWVLYYDTDGRRHREKAGTKKAAMDLYIKRKHDNLTGTKLPQNLRHKGERIDVVLDRAANWYREHRPKSRKVGIQLANLKRGLGHKVAVDLTPEDVDNWLSANKDWSPATKNRHKATLSRALHLELVAGRLTRNVAKLVMARREDNGRIRWLRDEEEARIVAVIMETCPVYLPSFTIALHTGMRQSEQYSLSWSEIDFDRRKIYLDRTKNGSSREVPMSKTCVQAFMELKATAVDKWVFHSCRIPENRLMNPRKWFDEAVAKAKVPDVTWHTLRHTFCSRLVMRGVDIRTVQVLAGHKSISMTMRYSHLSPEHNLAAIERLDSPQA